MFNSLPGDGFGRIKPSAILAWGLGTFFGPEEIEIRPTSWPPIIWPEKRPFRDRTLGEPRQLWLSTENPAPLATARTISQATYSEALTGRNDRPLTNKVTPWPLDGEDKPLEH